jgi:hypothetical protein
MPAFTTRIMLRKIPMGAKKTKFNHHQRPLKDEPV